VNSLSRWALPVSKRINLFLRRFRRLPAKYWGILASLFGLADFLTWSILADIEPSQRWLWTLGLAAIALVITVIVVLRQPAVDEAIAYARSLARMGRAAYNARDYPEALRLLEAAVRLDNDNLAAVGLLGRVLVCLGRFDEAISLLSRAIDLTQIDTNRHLLLIWRAIAAMYLGRLGSALADLDNIIKEVPKHTEALRLRATVWLLLDRLDNALCDLNAGLKVKPDYLCAHAIKAIVLKRCGNLEGASRELARCDALIPEDAVDIYHISLAYANLGRTDDALEMLRAAIQRDPRCAPRAVRDALFAEIKNDPRFIGLVAANASNALPAGNSHSGKD